MVLGHWIESMRRQRPWSMVDQSWFCSAQQVLSRKLLERCATLVAVNPSDDNHIYGYIVADPDSRVLVWVYVKGDFRELGVGASLMRAMFGDFGPKSSPIRYVTKTVASPHYHGKWGIVHEPYALVEMLKEKA
jgi:hypothetical protein